MNSNLTSNSVLLSTVHDRQRRAERQIEKITLKEARRYGMRETQNDGRIKYSYAGHVFIFDPKQNKAITSWKIDARKKHKDPNSGTRFYKPILIQPSTDHVSPEVQRSHEDMANHVRRSKDKWTSHTVLVVDMSGSMRDDDVDGARCRADAVWTTFARDFIQEQLENKTCSVYDVVSVVTMQQTAELVIACEPMTYVLFNKLVKFREWDNLKPKGHGFYKPALETAEYLLAYNSSGGCALTLMFFSDGKPSDYHKNNHGPFEWAAYNRTTQELIDLTGRIGSRFGRRLSAFFIGMAAADEDFRTLEGMAFEARVFGSQAYFHRPKLNTESLSQIVTSSVASSLESKLELSSSFQHGHRSTRSVRSDIERERRNAPDDRKVNQDWRVFHSNGEAYAQYVSSIYIWNPKVKNFARAIDPRCHHCFKAVANEFYELLPGQGVQCNRCLVCYFCTRCHAIGNMSAHQRSGACMDAADQRRKGFLVSPEGSKYPNLYNIAWKKQAFGEGAERLAFKFRFLGDRHQFVGPLMVAKESRFIEDLDDDSATNYLVSQRCRYHKSFMRTQAEASWFADLFNESAMELDQLQGIRSIPRIRFVVPVIYELFDKSNGRTYNILVEPLIEGRYKKFSDNFGSLAMNNKRDFFADNAGADLSQAAVLLGRKDEQGQTELNSCLDIIAEESEEEEEDGDCFNDISPSLPSMRGSSGWNKPIDVYSISDMDFLEAFSHFTYARSRGKMMVVDLQGALHVVRGEKSFVLTDPAIHHRRAGKSTRYGRTDLGRKGMRAFFESHKCNGICRLLGLHEKKDQEELDRLSQQTAVRPRPHYHYEPKLFFV